MTGRPCFNLIKNSLVFWKVLAHNLSSWRTFSVRMKCGINYVLEFILAFCLKGIVWKLKEYILDFKKNLLNNAEDSGSMFFLCYVLWQSLITGWSQTKSQIRTGGMLLWLKLALTNLRRFLAITYISYIKVLHNIFCIAGRGGKRDGTWQYFCTENPFPQKMFYRKHCCGLLWDKWILKDFVSYWVLH